jgi:hypothetical protein
LPKATERRQKRTGDGILRSPEDQQNSQGALGVVQVSGEAKELVSTTKSTKVPLFVGRLRIPRATGMPFGTRTGYGSYLPRKNTKAGTDAAENTHNS